MTVSSTSPSQGNAPATPVIEIIFSGEKWTVTWNAVANTAGYYLWESGNKLSFPSTVTSYVITKSGDLSYEIQACSNLGVCSSISAPKNINIGGASSSIVFASSSSSSLVSISSSASTSSYSPGQGAAPAIPVLKLVNTPSGKKVIQWDAVSNAAGYFLWESGAKYSFPSNVTSHEPAATGLLIYQIEACSQLGVCSGRSGPFQVDISASSLSSSNSSNNLSSLNNSSAHSNSSGAISSSALGVSSSSSSSSTGAGIVVKAPVISPAGGIFKNFAQITLSTDTQGAIIRYTVDGSEVTADSIKYSSPLFLFQSAKINAKVFLNENQSAQVSKQFTISEGIVDLKKSTELTSSIVNSEPITDIPSQMIGSLAGQFNVSESGAANYTVPVLMADGVAGVKPNVTVGYSSQAGNGLLGKGWSLSGLGSITRCRQTVAQDGIAMPISWSANDRFCLDGQRLMVVEGSYGAPGSIYKTEIDTYVTVTAIGGVVGNPDYFIAEAKDGSHTYYGASGNDSSELSTSKGVLTWAIKKFEDNVGNPIVYVYEGDFSEQRIKEILYAYGVSKAEGAYKAKVQFEYENRLDVSSMYVAGFLFKNTKRLKKIISFNESNVLRAYEISYEYAPRSLGKYSKVTALKECADVAGAYCFPATKFSWYQPTSSGYQTGLGSATTNSISQSITNFTFIDINGNGIQDFLWVENDSQNESFSTVRYILDLSRDTSDAITLLEYNSEDPARFELIDYNGDGHQDVLMFNPVDNKWKLFLSVYHHDGWRLQSSDILLPFASIPDIKIGDIDSDGLADAIHLENNLQSLKVFHLGRRNNADVTSNTFYEFKPESTYSFNILPVTTNHQITEKELFIADFNGDGQIDFGVHYKFMASNTTGGSVIASSPLKIYTAANNNTLEYFYSINTSSAMPVVINDIKTIDINGDGLMDIAFMKNDNWYYCINTGDSFLTATAIHSSENLSIGDVREAVNFVDLNRDGYLDVIWKQTSINIGQPYETTYVKYWNASNADFDVTEHLHVNAKYTSYSYIDINADTWVDRIAFGLNQGSGKMQIRAEGVSIESDYGSARMLNSDQIEKIEDGLGNVTSITYESIARSAHYLPIGEIKTFGSKALKCYPAEPSSPVPGVIMVTSARCEMSDLFTVDPSDYYRQINAPFADLNNNNLIEKPVLEAIGAFLVVTSVERNSPTASTLSPRQVDQQAKNKLEYYYEKLRIQAAGRGLLGFGALSVVDFQSGMTTKTKYRQDWPFIGLAVETTTFFDTNKVISKSVNEWTTKVSTYSGAKRYSPFIEKTTENTYSLNSDGSVNTTPHQTIVTSTSMTNDDYGNVESVRVVTSGGGSTLEKSTTNYYYPSEWERRMGRLESSTTSTALNGVFDSSRKVNFQYYPQGSAENGLLYKEIVESGTEEELSTTYSYDSWGNKIEIAIEGYAEPGRKETRRTINTYDLNGRYLVSSRNGLHQSLNIVGRDSTTGLVTETRDVNGQNASVRYDAMGREYLRIDSSGAWTRTDIVNCVGCLDGAKYYKLTRVAGGGQSIEYFDSLGRIIRNSKVGFDGRLINTDTEYDGLGRIKRQSTPYFNDENPAGWHTNTYDAVGRVTNITAPDTSVSKQTFNSYETVTTNALSHTRKETRNGLGQLVNVLDNLGGTIFYEYNALGDLLTATSSADGKNVVVKMCYDRLGRKTAMLDPDKGGFKASSSSCPSGNTTPVGWWLYKYNAFGELVYQRDPKGQVTSMVYDQLGRMIKRTEKLSNGIIDAHTRWYFDSYPDGTSSDVTKGKLTTLVMSTDGSEVCSGKNHCTTYTYDSKARPSDTLVLLPNDSTGYVSSIKYDSIGRPFEEYDALTGQVFTDSGIQIQYNNYGYAYRTIDIAPIDEGTGVLNTITQMNARGQVTQEIRGNGVTSVNYYNSASGLLERQFSTGPLGLVAVQDNSYRWDSVGNLKSRLNKSAKVGSAGTKNSAESFCYDGLNRLIKTVPSIATDSPNCNGEQDIRYDGFGNIKFKKNIGTYSYGINAGPHAVTSTTADGAFNYDDNGNQTGGSGRELFYTSYDMVKRISKAGSSTEFSYDANRARWQRVDEKNNVKTKTTYLGNIERIDTAGKVEWRRSVGGVVYSYTLDAITGQFKHSKNYIYNDHLGSLDLITDAVGVPIHSMSFDPWGAGRNGEAWSSSARVDGLSLLEFSQPITKRGFTGHEMVDEMGIIHMNGRIYDPRLGRFLQADPFIQAATNTQSYNRYSYVLNNPLNATDPSGYFSLKQFAGVIFAAVSCAYFGCGGALELIATSAGSGAVQAAANGGNLNAIVQGAVLGAFTGAAGGIGGNMGIITAGVIGGISSEFMGGSFGEGFMGALVGSVGATGNFYFDIASKAVASGTYSEMTGGKFANGAAAAAFSYAVAWGGYKIGNGVYSSGTADYSSIEKNVSNEEILKRVNEVREIFKGKKEIFFENFIAGEDTSGAFPKAPEKFNSIEDFMEWRDRSPETRGLLDGRTSGSSRKITIYRNTVLGRNGTVFLPNNMALKGYFSGIENALITVGHEVWHASAWKGRENFKNKDPHIYSNQNGVGWCGAAGYCRSQNLIKRYQ